jgi:membrane dipeptidase
MENENVMERLNVVGNMAVKAGEAQRPKSAGRQPGGPYPANFQKFHDGLIVIDASCPLMSLPKPPQIKQNLFDLYKKGGVTVGFASVGGPSVEQTLQYMTWVAKNMSRDPGLIMIHTVADIFEAKKHGKLSIVYQFQPTGALEGDIERAFLFKQAGLGTVQITYNKKTIFGCGCSVAVDEGLTQKGRDLVKVLNEAKIIVDVAHGGVKSALDTIEASNTVVVNSHGNARAVIDSPRNYPDEVLKAVAQKGGVTGICGYPTFLSTKATPPMEDFIRMTDYVVDLAGIDHVSIGMDYWFGQAGIASNEMAQKLYEYFIASGEWTTSVYPPPPWWFPEGIETPDTLANLSGALLARGYSEEDVAKIWGGNWLRVMKEVWGA